MAADDLQAFRITFGTIIGTAPLATPTSLTYTFSSHISTANIITLAKKIIKNNKLSLVPSFASGSVNPQLIIKKK